MSTPLRLGCSGLARATLKKTLPGTRYFFDSDYTRACPVPRLEICISQICFSDSMTPTPRKHETTLQAAALSLPGDHSFEAVLASQRWHRIMHRGRKTATAVVLNHTAVPQWQH
jgi:hypothetical protein